MKKVAVFLIALAGLALVAAGGWADTPRFAWVPVSGTYMDQGEVFTWTGNVLLNQSLPQGSQVVCLVAQARCEDCGKAFRLVGMPGQGPVSAGGFTFSVASLGHDPEFAVAMEIPAAQVALAN